MTSTRSRLSLALLAACLGALIPALAGAAPGRPSQDPAPQPTTAPTATASSTTFTNPAVTSTSGTATTVTPTYGLPYQLLDPYRATAPTRGALTADGPEDRYTLGGTWLFQPDPNGTGIAAGLPRPTAPTAAWSEVTVPNAWNAGDYSASGFTGTVGWYRRDFTLPADAFARYVPARARSWTLSFESVNYTAQVWLNGHLLGGHTGAYLPFEFPARDLHAGANSLVVRVDDTRTSTSFPAGPMSGWWNFGGILDAVYLRPVQGADLDTATIRPVLACPACAATITEQATVVNRSARPETVQLDGAYGPVALHFGRRTLAPGATWRPTATARLGHPRLWSPARPHLYDARLTLTDAAGRRLGGYRYLSGVRLITVKHGLLYLNGRQLHLRGVSIHEQTVATGAALSVAQQAQLLGWAHQVGADIIREHYPLDPEAAELADRDGLLVWSEIPVYGSLTPEATDEANLESPSWRQAAADLLAANIAANQNHPSVLVWSIANELPATANPAESAYIAAAAAEVHRLDPTRPAAMAVLDWPGLGCQGGYRPLDVIGVNEYYGWFDEAGGQTEDRQGLEPFLQSVRACYPNQAVMVTEMGYGANRNGPIEVRGTYPYQIDNLQYAFGVMSHLRWLAGALWFPLQDFAAEPGYDGGEPIGTPPFVDKGVVDPFGNLKPGFAAMSAIFHATRQVDGP